MNVRDVATRGVCGSFTHLVGMRTQAECASTSLVADLGAQEVSLPQSGFVDAPSISARDYGSFGQYRLAASKHFAGVGVPFLPSKSEEENHAKIEFIRDGFYGRLTRVTSCDGSHGDDHIQHE
jgi:hypothetical protein